MNVTTTGRRINLRDSFLKTVQKRLDKFDRFFPEEADANVTVSMEKDRITTEITVKSGGFFFRTERTGNDLASTFNEAADLMMRQIVKNKEKLGNRVRTREVEIAGEELNYAVPEEGSEEYSIARKKTFKAEPMTPQALWSLLNNFFSFFFFCFFFFDKFLQNN